MKKLVAMVVGGVTVVGSNYRFIANAQNQVECDPLLAEVFQLNERRMRLGHFAREAAFITSMEQVYQIIQSQDIPLEEAERIVNEDLFPWMARLENARQRQEQNQERRVGFLSLLNPLNWLNAWGRSFGNLVGSLENWFNNLIHLQQQNAPRVARDNALDGVQRGNHITAGANSHVHSVSDHDLTHEGAGAALITGPGRVEVDDGAIIVSECDDDLKRNVTVNEARSLSVASHVHVQLQNATEFETEEKAKETLINLLRAMNPQEVAQVMKELFGQMKHFAFLALSKDLVRSVQI